MKPGMKIFCYFFIIFVQDWVIVSPVPFSDNAHCVLRSLYSLYSLWSTVSFGWVRIELISLRVPMFNAYKIYILTYFLMEWWHKKGRDTILNMICMNNFLFIVHQTIITFHSSILKLWAHVLLLLNSYLIHLSTNKFTKRHNSIQRREIFSCYAWMCKIFHVWSQLLNGKSFFFCFSCY